MRFMFCFVVWAGVLIFNGFSDEPKRLVFLGDHDYPPITFLQDNAPQGLYVDIANALGQISNVDFSVGVEDWKTAQDDVKQGKASVLLGMAYTPERAQEFDFTDPVTETEFSIFYQTTSFFLGKVNDLAGKRVGVTAGGLPRKLLEKRGDLALSLYSSYEAGFRDLVAGKIDTFCGDKWVGSYVVQKFRFENVALSERPFVTLKAGFAVIKGNKSLVLLLNKGLNTLRTSGKLASIIAKWTPQKIVYITAEQLGNSVLLATALVSILLIVTLFAWILILRKSIRDRERAEEALNREKEQLAVTLRSIADGVIATNLENRVTIMNKVAEGLTGWMLSEAQFLPLSTVFHVSPSGQDDEQGIAIEKVQVLTDRQGNKKLITGNTAPIHDQEGETIGLVVVFRDVTEKEKTEELLKNAQKLESIGVLAGGIAHDFNNLLSGIFGNAEHALLMLQRKVFDKAEENMTKILSVLGRARQLTHHLLTFAKGGDPHIKPHLINDLVKKTVNFALSGSKVLAEFKEDASWLCDIDEHQIAQVVDNITINAKQAMEDGGRLIVCIEKTMGEKGRDWIRISFRDSGAGIGKEILPKIFDPFFTTKRQGTGLGLATAYSIIKKHGGRLIAESDPPNGSTFYLDLPLSKNNAVLPVPNEIITFTGQGKVMVVDDDPSVLDVTEEMLLEMGMQVVRASNGASAIEAVVRERNSERPIILAILDLIIPGEKGGKEILDDLQSLDPQLKFIAASGYSEGPVIANPEAYGFHASLAKPYRRQDLVKVLREVLGSLSE